MNIDLSSPTLRYGIGCFETLRFEPPNRILFLREHCERLSIGAGICRINCLPVSEMIELTRRVVACQDFRSPKVLRLILTPETGLSLLHEDLSIRPEQIKLIISEQFHYPAYSSLSVFKSFNYLAPYLAGQSAKQVGADGSLMLNAADPDQIVCAHNGNLFFLDEEGFWHTPALSSGCLPGVIRALLVLFLRAEERRINLSELKRFKGAILTNSLIDARSVHQIGTQNFTPLNLKPILDYLSRLSLK
ncbi:MAG: aminotransferase class IV [Candidatus Caenarcaniphilales bacterium]|nr:aminotransferase class IV [Candidatus Caenarcaniphilales bacterium]